MATAIELQTATVDALDQAIATGRFSTRDEAIRTALQIVHDIEAADLEVDPETIAAIEEGIADAEAGRVFPAEQVFAELRQRYQHWR